MVNSNHSQLERSIQIRSGYLEKITGPAAGLSPS